MYLSASGALFTRFGSRRLTENVVWFRTDAGEMELFSRFISPLFFDSFFIRTVRRVSSSASFDIVYSKYLILTRRCIEEYVLWKAGMETGLSRSGSARRPEGARRKTQKESLILRLLPCWCCCTRCCCWLVWRVLNYRRCTRPPITSPSTRLAGAYCAFSWKEKKVMGKKDKKVRRRRRYIGWRSYEFETGSAIGSSFSRRVAGAPPAFLLAALRKPLSLLPPSVAVFTCNFIRLLSLWTLPTPLPCSIATSLAAYLLLHHCFSLCPKMYFIYHARQFIESL